MYTDKNNYSYRSIKTHILVCIHKNVCTNNNYNYTYRSNYLYFLYNKWNKNVKNYIPQHHY